MLTFYPYLFDSKDAWEKSVSDINYRYDMTLTQFMVIYNKYRITNQSKNTKEHQWSSSTFELPNLPKNTKREKEIHPKCEEILNQSEIDEVLKYFH